MLTLICGLPNAGKTTYSGQYATVLHYDDFTGCRSREDKINKCNMAAAQIDGDVCVEGIYNKVDMRRSLIETCIDKSPKICIWIDTPMDECIRREDRGRPQGVVRFHAKGFEAPTIEEGWDEIIIIQQEKR